MGLLTSAAARAVAALVAAVLAAAPAAGEPSLEHRVKAAYVYKFLGFVRWPTQAEGGVLRVGVFGSAPLAEALETLEGRRAGDLRIEVRRIEAATEVDDCRVLVLGTPIGPRTRELLARARERPILTVGEAWGFARGDGIVEFVIAGETVRFEIDLASAERAGLQIDSRLLRVATAVHRDGPEQR